MTEAVLPRPRTRRRRSKPPPPSLWRALLWVLADAFFTGINIAALGTSPPWLAAIQLLSAAGWVWFFLRIDWPRFLREWRAWQDDE